ncbi:MAG: hypothetical protein LUQ59_05040 [Methanothrix sp.]|nr:hypothetical protein [Methanothrix sp.]
MKKTRQAHLPERAAGGPWARSSSPGHEDIEGMIQSRLAERTWPKSTNGRQRSFSDGEHRQDPCEREARRRKAARGDEERGPGLRAGALSIGPRHHGLNGEIAKNQ